MLLMLKFDILGLNLEQERKFLRGVSMLGLSHIAASCSRHISILGLVRFAQPGRVVS